MITHTFPAALMFRSTAQWIKYDENETYTLTLAFPDIPVFTYRNNRNQINVAVCSSCKNKNTFHPSI